MDVLDDFARAQPARFALCAAFAFAAMRWLQPAVGDVAWVVVYDAFVLARWALLPCALLVLVRALLTAEARRFFGYCLGLLEACAHGATLELGWNNGGGFVRVIGPRNQPQPQPAQSQPQQAAQQQRQPENRPRAVVAAEQAGGSAGRR